MVECQGENTKVFDVIFASSSGTAFRFSTKSPERSNYSTLFSGTFVSHSHVPYQRSCDFSSLRNSDLIFRFREYLSLDFIQQGKTANFCKNATSAAWTPGLTFFVDNLTLMTRNVKLTLRWIVLPRCKAPVSIPQIGAAGTLLPLHADFQFAILSTIACE